MRHPLLAGRPVTNRAKLLVLTANRGYCGGYNSNIIRAAWERWSELSSSVPQVAIEISGKRGITAFGHRGHKPDETFTHFEHRPKFEEVELIANRYLNEFVAGELDRLDVAYMKFINLSRQVPVVETLLPLGSLAGRRRGRTARPKRQCNTSFCPPPRAFWKRSCRPASR